MFRTRPAALVLFIISFAATACSSKPAGAPIVIDGSSTVHPISVAAAAEFTKKNAGQVVNVTSSSTGVGLKRFCAGELDVADASRHINSAEDAACAAAGVEYLEVPIAYDAITVVVHRGNTWASSITVAELKKIWEPGAEGKITKWRQVRKDWPDREIHLVGPDAESGTFDYFNEAITGGAKKSRKDYTGHTDDNKIVAAVEGDELALGYLGFTYYEKEHQKLKALAVDDLHEQIGPGAIEPTLTNVGRGVYLPLSRPLFLYVRAKSLDRPEVQRFVDFYARFASEIVPSVGGVPLTRRESELVLARVIKRVLGTMFAAPTDEGDVSLQVRLSRHQ